MIASYSDIPLVDKWTDGLNVEESWRPTLRADCDPPKTGKRDLPRPPRNWDSSKGLAQDLRDCGAKSLTISCR